MQVFTWSRLQWFMFVQLLEAKWVSRLLLRTTKKEWIPRKNILFLINYRQREWRPMRELRFWSSNYVPSYKNTDWSRLWSTCVLTNKTQDSLTSKLERQALVLFFSDCVGPRRVSCLRSEIDFATSSSSSHPRRYKIFFLFLGGGEEVLKFGFSIRGGWGHIHKKLLEFLLVVGFTPAPPVYALSHRISFLRHTFLWEIHQRAACVFLNDFEVAE